MKNLNAVSKKIGFVFAGGFALALTVISVSGARTAQADCPCQTSAVDKGQAIPVDQQVNQPAQAAKAPKAVAADEKK